MRAGGSPPVAVAKGARPMPEPRAEPPVSCTLDGASMGERVQEWRDLLAEAVAREDVPRGVRLTFPADAGLAARVTRLAADELGCCAFYEFTVELRAAALVLTVRAPAEAAPLLADLFGVPA